MYSVCRLHSDVRTIHIRATALVFVCVEVSSYLFSPITGGIRLESHTFRKNYAEEEEEDGKKE